MDIYKQACVVGLRFNTTKGQLTVEQLYQLNQTELTTCIKAVSKNLKKNDDEGLSFLDSTVSIDKTEQLRFDILKDVYLTKKELSEATRKAKEDKEYNQKIIEIIAEKKEGKLKDMSIEDLEKMLK